MKTKSSRLEQCPVCGHGKLENKTGEFPTHFEDDLGHPKDLVVADLAHQQCNACREELLDDVATRRVSDAQRSAMGLLSASEIKQIRTDLRQTQHQMSELLGIGEKTYCRWESGSHFQSEAFDRYLRLLRELPENIAALERIRRDKANETRQVEMVHEFQYLPDTHVFEFASVKFVQLLRTTGPFCTA